jgi:hypothetical protein
MWGLGFIGNLFEGAKIRDAVGSMLSAVVSDVIVCVVLGELGGRPNLATPELARADPA